MLDDRVGPVVAGRLSSSSNGAAPRGVNANARDAHSAKALRSSAGDSSNAPSNGQNLRGRAPDVHYGFLPSDQRELCVGFEFEYEAAQRWERIVSGGA